MLGIDQNGRKHRGPIRVTLAAGAVLVSALALRTDLRLATYTVESEKLKRPLRLALLTDLHSCAYGAGQRTLLDMLHAQKPDMVLLGGDIVDDKLPPCGAWTVLRAMAARYPCFYVSGNHEFYSGRAAQIKARIAAYGIGVLEGATQALELRGQRLTVSGVDDPKGGEAAFTAQLERCGRQVEAQTFGILLTHRPERIAQYRQWGFDLVLAGHAHGGQWRLPGVLNGLLAPGQGLFPPYAGGQYPFSDSTMVVSRGLARESTVVPRIFNRPELVVIDLQPCAAETNI